MCLTGPLRALRHDLSGQGRNGGGQDGTRRSRPRWQRVSLPVAVADSWQQAFRTAVGRVEQRETVLLAW